MASYEQAGSFKKGRSLNHLLNFSFPEREKGLAVPPPRRRGRVPIYSKERYLHASFRFLVSDTEQYIAHLADPDLNVDWDNIEQVIISLPRDQNCPICLSEPVAPRITRCGHIFCYACILHYLALGEKHWRRCPICFDAVNVKDLKYVRINKMVPYGEGDTIRMVLMQKMRVPSPSLSVFPLALVFSPPLSAPPEFVCCVAKDVLELLCPEHPADLG